jgi:hypothetical protein
VRAVGACHPVIDGNNKLLAGGDNGTSRAAGVVCVAATLGGASRCVVIGNKLIQGAPSNHPLLSIGVMCDTGSCVRVAGNVINGGGGGNVVGVYVNGGATFVERNNVTGGCGVSNTSGVATVDASSRIENNLVRGAVCSNNLTTAQAVGVYVQVGTGSNEVDVHSNTVDAGGTGACKGAAAAMVYPNAGNPPPRQSTFRNNILRAGACAAARYGFWEQSPPIEPRIFQNNDLDPTGSPTALYLDANATPLATAAAVNALTGTFATGNISVDPMFVAAPSDLRLGSASMCVDAGTTVGAPPRDYTGKARDAKPDIGAYEK